MIGFVVINFRFEYSIFTYFTNYKANMEEELIDKYENGKNVFSKRGQSESVKGVYIWQEIQF